MTEAAPITAVVVTYRSKATVGDALAALEPLHAAGTVDTVVVDNASDDGTAEFVRSRYPWVRTIEMDENLGFGRGCNRAMQEVASPYVLFLNPDAVIDFDGLATLLDVLESRPEAGFAAPAVRDPSGAFHLVGGLPTPWQILREAAGFRSRSRRALRPGEPPFRTDCLSGAVVLARTNVMRELGGFDPRFFLYFEETDLWRRALARRIEIWAVGQAVAFHAHAASARAVGATMYANCIAEHYFQSRFYFLVKHFGRSAAVATELAELALLGLRAVPSRLRSGASYARLRARLRAPLLRLPSPPVAERGAR